MHGLRHSDYANYRAYCTRKIHTISRKLKMADSVDLYPVKVSIKVRVKPIEIFIIHFRNILLFLFNAERAWAYAFDLKTNIDDHPRYHFHLVKRLHKATQHSQKLIDLCAHDQQLLSQATAYHYNMAAHEKLARKEWDAALDLFTKSRYASMH